jgi:hypothetical protein
LLINICYDINLTENFALGAQFGCMAGDVKSLNVIKKSNSNKIHLDKDEYVNITRLELSVGLRLIK